MTTNRRHLENRLVRLGTLMAPPPTYSDDEIVQALADGTATPAHLDYLYPIIAEDLVTSLYWWAPRIARNDWDNPKVIVFDCCPVARALKVLNFGADERVPSKLLKARTRACPYDPASWEKTPRGLRNQAARDRLRDLSFVLWVKADLVNQALPTPDCRDARLKIDGWRNGGPAPIDVDRTPSTRVVRLLAPLDIVGQLPLLMLRGERKAGRPLNIRETPPIPRRPRSK